jgi:hypothetical protein
MRRAILTIATASTLLFGCATATTSRDANDAKSHAPRPADGVTAKIVRTSFADDVYDVAADERELGDYVVFRFSGSFQKQPLTLKQTVVGRSGGVVAIDMELTRGTEPAEALRVVMSDAPASQGELLGVYRADGAEWTPTSTSAYDQLMARVVVSADANEELLGTEETTVEVDDTSIACDKTTFRVRIGAVEATLSTLTSADFPWGDVGGEITSESGEVIYKAELLEIGHDDTLSVHPYQPTSI